MPLIKPFKAVIYNKNKIKDISKVVAPPYDVIPKDMQDTLYRAHPDNIVRLILGKIKKSDTQDDNRYTRAKIFFETWLKDKAMVRDDKDAIYIYSQLYKESGRTIDQIGFMGLMEIERDTASKVLPHENTLLAPKVDRLNLMRSVKANLSPVFVLYEDGPHKIVNIMKRFCSRRDPFIDIKFDKVRHRVWRLDDARDIEKIRDIMKDKDIFIADGHHRYEVSRMYAREIEDKDIPESVKENSRYLMVYFVESDDNMLTILPTHRVVKDIGNLSKKEIKEKLERFFLIKKVKGLSALMPELSRLSKAHAFGLYLGNGDFYVLKLKNPEESDRIIANKPEDWKRLDVSILHLFILQHLLGIRDEDDNVEFFKNAQDAVKSADSGKSRIAFFLNPTKVAQVKRIAKLGEKMPRKSTYFYPKPLSGLVINKY